MGTPDFAAPSLQTLIQTQHVVGVVTQPDKPAGRGNQLRPSPVKLIAQAANIPVYQPKSLKSQDAAAPLYAWQPDVIVVAAFGQILRAHVLDLPPYGCINIHASLLPRWRGASPIQHALLAGDAQTGVCLMQMDVGLDTGPVYVCEAIPISAEDTAVSLHDRLAQLGADLLRQHLPAILSGQLSAMAQDDSQSTYAPMIKKEQGIIDWQQSSQHIDRHIRAMTPWPGAYTTWQGQVLKILRATPAALAHAVARPGQVLAQNGRLFVHCGTGSIQLGEVQLAGKKAMTADDFLRGHTHFTGSLLGD